MTLIDRLTRIFTWWNGATPLTRLGVRGLSPVGEDAFGNRYYETKRGRRIVIYNGVADGSRVAPEWYIWMNSATMPPPSKQPLPRAKWVKPPLPNLTGTPGASMPSGALQKSGLRARATGDYEAWTPGE